MTDKTPDPKKAELLEDDRDEFLALLVSLGNTGLNVGVTLYVGGAVICGNLISGKQFFTEFGEQFVSKLPGQDLKDATSPYFEGLVSLYDLKSAPKGTYPPRDYIHLSNARWHHPSGNLPTGPGTLWRGRLSAIDGFNLGVLVRE